jgi:hypothetical protein
VVGLNAKIYVIIAVFLSAQYVGMCLKPFSFTKTDHNDLTEILLKVASNTITSLKLNP